jgi:hypothetical protein
MWLSYLSWLARILCATGGEVGLFLLLLPSQQTQEFQNEAIIVIVVLPPPEVDIEVSLIGCYFERMFLS